MPQDATDAHVADPQTPHAQTVEITCDVLVVGGGLGGVAAALRAGRLGRTVCLIEETGWLGGQISTQGVSHLDEHQYIETFGGTAAYYELRAAIRQHYRSRHTLASGALREPALNPGRAWVSRLSFEPSVGAAVLEELTAPLRAAGTLQVFYRTQAVSAEVTGRRITSLLARQTGGAGLIRFRPAFVLDATDLGDLFVLTGTAYTVGVESRAETGEPSAPRRADPACTQAFTFPFAVEFCPGEAHTIPKPPGYQENRAAQPYSLSAQPHQAGAPVYRMSETAPGTYGPFFTYRRVLAASNFDDPRVPRDVAIINWPSNDFRGGSPVDRLPAEQARLWAEARQLSLGFLHWLQTEAPRDGGGYGFPELRPRPDIMGSADGLSQAPYIREGRRLRATQTIREQDIAAASHPGARAARFPGAAGIGFYPIDLHDCRPGTVSVPTRPFQIPLGALVPVEMVNLLPAAKNIGTTHITNGAYRLHPVEWAVGEAAAALAVFCLRVDAAPQEVHARADLTRRLQLTLLDQGVPLYWYDDVPLSHPAFAGAQLLAVEGIWEGEPGTLHFAPGETLTLEEGKRLVSAAARGIRRWRNAHGARSAGPDAASPQPGPEDATTPLRWTAAATLIANTIPGAAVPPQPGDSQTVTRADLAFWLGRLLREAIESGAAL